MMANPLAAFGIVTGLIAVFLVYRSRKRWQPVIASSILVFLALGTPLQCVILPAIAGIWVNKRLYRYREINWFAFLVSLPGVIVVATFLSGTGRLYLTLYAAGPMSLGAALGKGITMGLLYLLFVVAGVVSYALASLGTSIWRWRRH